MTATNQQMTSEQLTDLSILAVQLQAKAEANDDRDTAVMAYAVQKACAELIESRREFTAANATIHNLELKVVQSVAENAGLKELIEQHAGSIAVCPNCSHEEPSETDDIVALYRSLETPATDAAIANIQAQGVEMYAEATIAIGEEEQNEDIVYAGKQALLFAAQLRQGAEHE